jgi:glycosyltransferase involved in cell wall biosynthesis
MACGCPVITTHSSSLPEVGGDACVYINGDDHREMAGAMRRMTIDAEFRRGIATKGMQRSNAFSWQKCAKETLVSYTLALRLREKSA